MAGLPSPQRDQQVALRQHDAPRALIGDGGVAAIAIERKDAPRRGQVGHEPVAIDARREIERIVPGRKGQYRVDRPATGLRAGRRHAVGAFGQQRDDLDPRPVARRASQRGEGIVEPRLQLVGIDPRELGLAMAGNFDADARQHALFEPG